VYVHPAYARSGLGTRLLDWAEVRARERDREMATTWMERELD